MSEQAAALPLPPGSELSTSDREALLEAGRLTGLGELVRGFAHEINNPLFGMLGLVELLLREIEPGTKAHEHLSLVNAQQSMPSGGTVTVELERDGDWAVARVTDTGPGIDPEARPSLFEPFSTTKAGGT